MICENCREEEAKVDLILWDKKSQTRMVYVVCEKCAKLLKKQNKVVKEKKA